MARKANYFALRLRVFRSFPAVTSAGAVAVGNAFQLEVRKGSCSLNSSSGEASSNELRIGGGVLAAGRKVAQNPTIIRYVV